MVPYLIWKYRPERYDLKVDSTHLRSTFWFYKEDLCDKLLSDACRTSENTARQYSFESKFNALLICDTVEWSSDAFETQTSDNGVFLIKCYYYVISCYKNVISSKNIFLRSSCFKTLDNWRSKLIGRYELTSCWGLPDLGINIIWANFNWVNQYFVPSIALQSVFNDWIVVQESFHKTRSFIRLYRGAFFLLRWLILSCTSESLKVWVIGRDICSGTTKKL